MPCCMECGVKFKYGQVMYSGLFGYKPIACKLCGHVHTVTNGSRMKVSVIVAAIPIITVSTLRITLLKDITLVQFILLYLALVIPLAILIPYLMRYSR